MMMISEGRLYFRSTSPGNTSNPYKPFDPVAHRWLRIAHAGSVVAFQTSADGITWVTDHTRQSAVSPTQQVLVLAGTYERADVAPGGATFDNFAIRCAP